MLLRSGGGLRSTTPRGECELKNARMDCDKFEISKVKNYPESDSSRLGRERAIRVVVGKSMHVILIKKQKFKVVSRRLIVSGPYATINS